MRKGRDDFILREPQAVGIQFYSVHAGTAHYAFYEKRNGFAGELSGVRFNGEYRISKAAISAGIDYDDFRRESSRAGNARKYWAGVMYELNKMFSALARVEDNTNFNFDHSWQGFAALNINY